jgi:hypothetical protein
MMQYTYFPRLATGAAAATDFAWRAGSGDRRSAGLRPAGGLAA